LSQEIGRSGKSHIFPKQKYAICPISRSLALFFALQCAGKEIAYEIALGFRRSLAIAGYWFCPVAPIFAPACDKICHKCCTSATRICYTLDSQLSRRYRRQLAIAFYSGAATGVMDLIEILQQWGWAAVVAYWLMKVAFPAVFERFQKERDSAAEREATVEDRLYKLLEKSQCDTQEQIDALEALVEQRLREAVGVLREEIRTNMHNVSASVMASQYEMRDLRVAISDRLPRIARTRAEDDSKE
jgi:hypothetical protein